MTAAHTFRHLDQVQGIRDLFDGPGHHRRGERAGRRGCPVDHDDLATITPYITHTIRRLGDLVLDLDPPDTVPTTRLDLEPRALFPGCPAA
ncbi:hypothetical protein ACWDKQ_21840 [Saccharopolyspora sp. NPDC000995]